MRIYDVSKVSLSLFSFYFASSFAFCSSRGGTLSVTLPNSSKRCTNQLRSSNIRKVGLLAASHVENECRAIIHAANMLTTLLLSSEDEHRVKVKKMAIDFVSALRRHGVYVPSFRLIHILCISMESN